MRIINLKTNHIVNPLGFALDTPRLSWVVVDAKGQHQKAAKVEVALDADFDQVLFDSGKEKDIDSLFSGVIALGLFSSLQTVFVRFLMQTAS